MQQCIVGAPLWPEPPLRGWPGGHGSDNGGNGTCDAGGRQSGAHFCGGSGLAAYLTRPPMNSVFVQVPYVIYSDTTNQDFATGA